MNKVDNTSLQESLPSFLAAFSCFFLIFAMMSGFAILGGSRPSLVHCLENALDVSGPNILSLAACS